MAAQLPPGVASFAAGILVYSLFCFSFGPLLLYLTWVHNERFSCKFSCGLDGLDPC